MPDVAEDDELGPLVVMGLVVTNRYITPKHVSTPHFTSLGTCLTRENRVHSFDYL